jgi:hypothetical protein
MRAARADIDLCVASNASMQNLLIARDGWSRATNGTRCFDREQRTPDAIQVFVPHCRQILIQFRV